MEKFIYQAILSKDEGGGYSVEVPDLPGCFTYGDDYSNAAFMAADAAKTYIASTLAAGDEVPAPRRHDVPEGCESVHVFFEADPGYIVQGEVVSAAQAARDLGVSAGRVTHMIDAGLLDGYRSGRRTYVTKDSIAKRLSEPRGSGRPRQRAEQA